MPKVIPLAGVTTVDYAIENGRGGEVELNEEEIAEIDQVLATCEVGDDRYHPDGIKSING